MSRCCCGNKDPSEKPSPCCGGGKDGDGGSSCCAPRGRIDWLLWGSLIVVSGSCIAHLFFAPALEAGPASLEAFAEGIYALASKAWWGILAGIAAVAVIGQLPRELVAGLLGRGGTFSGILRATFAGTLLDLCNHGILLVGMQLYKKGASLGQTLAFLIASPWNSLSLTLILFALIGWKWTLAFLLLSMLIGIATGWATDRLVAAGRLPANPNHRELPADFRFGPAFREASRQLKPTPANLRRMVATGLTDSAMILRWIFFGLAMAGAIRAFVPTDLFQHYFGPTLLGLLLTLAATTAIEVCSEGSSPIAADLLTRAGAPGNAFTFLMAGAATDYTEILALRQTTGSWKATLALPLLSTPQVLAISWVLNHFQ
jgi:uncharacterized membrane protein YraQ (UPF0718 family)